MGLSWPMCLFNDADVHSRHSRGENGENERWWWRELITVARPVCRKHHSRHNAGKNGENRPWSVDLAVCLVLAKTMARMARIRRVRWLSALGAFSPNLWREWRESC